MAITSEKLNNERKELGDFIRTLNDHYHDKGIYFRFDSLLDIETEEKKNQELRDSDYFYIIFCDKADDSIVKRFDVALQHFKEKNSPRIYTYFQKLPDGSAATESVKNFMERLDKEIGHYYSVFSHLDSIKLNMLLELTRTQVLSGKVDIKDGKALVDGQEMLSLENVPIFRNNEEFHNLIKERDELQKVMTELALQYTADPSDIEVSQQLSNNAVRRKEITEQLHQMEKNMLEICSAIAERNSSGKPITWREKEASRYLDEGNYESALAVLRDTNRIVELEQARAVKKSGNERIIGFINEDRLRIQTLEAKGINSNTLPEIYECYEEAVKIAEEELVETDIIYEYAVFLYLQKNYKESFKKAEWLKRYYNLNNDSNSITDSKKAKLFNLLGPLLQTENRYEEAEKEYLKAIAIGEKLEDENPEAYDLVFSYLNFSEFLYNIHDYKQAEEIIQKATASLKRLEEKENGAYIAFLASNYTLLGVVFKETNRYADAEKAFKKAVMIWETIAREAPEVLIELEDKLATNYNNLGIVFKDTNRYSEAEETYEKAKMIWEKLVATNPAAYENDLANTYGNLGDLFRITHRNAEAEEFYEKAVVIWEKISGETAEAFKIEDGNKLAAGYYNLGNVFKATNRYADAETAFKKAVIICEKIARETPEVFKIECENKLAASYNSLGNVFKDSNRYTEAEEAYEKAKTIWEKLAAASPEVYDEHDEALALSYNNLGNVFIATRRYTEAEETYEKAKTIWEKLAAANPEVYDEGLALSYYNLMILFKETNHYAEAKKVLKKAIIILEKLSRENPVAYESRLVSCYTILGHLLDITGSKNEALEAFMKASSLKKNKKS